MRCQPKYLWDLDKWNPS